MKYKKTMSSRTSRQLKLIKYLSLFRELDFKLEYAERDLWIYSLVTRIDIDANRI